MTGGETSFVYEVRKIQYCGVECQHADLGIHRMRERKRNECIY